jgi:hypothetical protein
VQCEIAEGFVGLSVADKIFPMRYLDPENDAEIFMLNSVVVDDSLVASASGELAEALAERFGAMVAASTARNIVVLIHHAPFRWADEPQPTFLGQDSLRWSSLAMSNNSAKQFIEPLAAALDKGRSVVFCCGHRHGGPEKKTTLGTWRGVLISEGASLAESDAAISALGFTPHGIAARLIASE